VPTVVPSSPHDNAPHCIVGTSLPLPTDQALAQITANWADLPDAIKAGIVALVQAVGGSNA
jgi:hypothetical protein